MKKRLLVIIFSLMALSCHAQTENNISKQGVSMQQFMNPANWKTYCTGRYLVDLPTSLNPEWAGGDRINKDEIIWQPELKNRQQVLAKIEQMKTDLKNLHMPDKSKRTLLPREDGKSYIVEQVDYVNGGVGLLLRKASSGNGMTLINYLITEKPFRVFYYQVEFVFDSDKEKIITQTRLLANSLRSRAENEIPKGAGLCIYGGFIAGEHKNLKETSSIKLNYPYFSEKYYFQIGLGNIVTREPMTVHPKKQLSSTPKIIKVFRDTSSKQVAGLKGMEYGIIRSNDWHKEVPLYDFMWHYPGTASSSFDPHLAIYMGYVKREYREEKAAPKYLAFANETEVLALWDKILNSVRKRPE